MSIKGIGLFKSIKKRGEGFAHLKIQLDGEKATGIFYMQWKDRDGESNPISMWYSFEYSLSERYPKIDRKSWRPCVPEDKLINVDMGEQECPDLNNLWNKLFKRLNWRTRRQIYDELGNDNTTTLQKEWAKRFKPAKLKIGDIVNEYQTVKKRMEEIAVSLNDPLLKDIMNSCDDVARLLGWNGKSEVERRVSDDSLTEARWLVILSNPYHLVYGHERFAGHPLYGIKKNDLNKVDKLFIKHGRMKPDEDRRLEYLLDDAINRGKYPLRNTATCYTKEQLCRKMGDRAREKRIDNNNEEDEDRDTQGLKGSVPDDSKVHNFLERVKNGGKIDPRCVMRIRYDRGYFYDDSTLEKEITLSKVLAKRIRTNTYVESLEEDWDEFKHRYKKYIDLSQEQERVLRRLLGLGFFIVLGAAGTGKTNLEATLVVFLEWMGYAVYIGTMVGKAAVRCRDVILKKDKEFKGKHESKVAPKTLHRLYYDVLDLGRENKNRRVILIVDEISTAPYSPLVDVLHVLGPIERIYWFGDEKQLPPILGQHLLDDLIELKDNSFSATLTTIYRGQSSSAALASRMWTSKSDYDKRMWIEDLKKCGGITVFTNPNTKDILSVVDSCLKNRSEGTTVFTNFPMIIASTKKVVEAIGEGIRPLWLKEMDKDVHRLFEADVASGKQQTFYKGDRVMCTKNIYAILDESGGYMETEWTNEEDPDAEFDDEQEKLKAKRLSKKVIIFAHGEIGIVREVCRGRNKIRIERLTSEGIPCGIEEEYEPRLFKVTYAFTVNKAQGSENDKTIFIYGSNVSNDGCINNVYDHMNRWRGYTGFTRHRKYCWVFGTDEQHRRMLNNCEKHGYRSFLTARIREELDADYGDSDEEFDEDSDEGSDENSSESEFKRPRKMRRLKL